MPSQHLKDLRAVWGQSCHSMWIELLSLRCTNMFLLSKYESLEQRSLLTDIVYAPESKGRLQDITSGVFLQRLDGYLQAVVTDRIVLLSAAFELYFRHFLEDYLMSKRKYVDAASGALNAEGNRVLGRVMGTRGLAERVEAFGDATGSKIGSIRPKLPALSDVYVLRNVLAHRAGHVDSAAAARLQTLTVPAGSQLVLSISQLLTLAAPVLEIASALDSRLS